MKKALITGITGQDGSYLTEFLLEKGYEVHGMVRRTATPNTKNIEHLKHKITLHYGDMTDSNSINDIVKKLQPDEIYNLAAQSHVRVSFDVPYSTVDITGMGVLRVLEAIRKYSPQSKMYQASSSECFGNSPAPQNEETILNPQSPYACAKVMGYHLVKLYRKAYGIFACNGILFNHESERRSDNFVTKKVTKAVARIKLGLQTELELGNLDAQRDWGYALEYMEAAWMMLQQDKPGDFVIATNETHSVKEFVEEAFNCVGLTWESYVKFNKDFIRPAEVNILQGNYDLAKKTFGWTPKIKFKELIKLMVNHDLKNEK